MFLPCYNVTHLFCFTTVTVVSYVIATISTYISAMCDRQLNKAILNLNLNLISLIRPQWLRPLWPVLMLKIVAGDGPPVALILAVEVFLSNNVKPEDELPW